jgi:hypothetical protein
MPKRLAATLAFLLLAGGGTGWFPSYAADNDSVVFIGAGDIANCDKLDAARATARLLEGIDGMVFTLGDHVYPTGSAKQFRDCYSPTRRFTQRLHLPIARRELPRSGA